MKKLYYSITFCALLTVVCFVLSGCSKKTATNKATSTKTVASEELFPGVDRSTLVTPSGVAPSGSANGSTGTTTKETAKTNLKIGSTTRIRAGKYELEGLIRIKSANSVSLESFSYNGTCSGFNLYLTRSNNYNLVIVPFNLFNRVYNSESYANINFPTNVTINDIDAIAMTCTDRDEPVFVTPLE